MEEFKKKDQRGQSANTAASATAQAKNSQISAQNPQG